MHTLDTIDSLEKYGLKEGNLFSPLVLIRVHPDAAFHLPGVKLDHTTLLGFVLEIDHSFEKKVPPKKAYWKLPAEHANPGETPIQTAVRGVRGEIGLHLRPESFTFIHEKLYRDRSHHQILFTADIPFSDLKMVHPYDIENEGEEARYFTIAQFHELVEQREFFNWHYEDLVSNNLVPHKEPARLSA